MYATLIKECQDNDLGECLSGIIYGIEEKCAKYETDPTLVIPKGLYELRHCLDSIWHVAAEGLDTYLQNTGFASEDDVVRLASDNIDGSIIDRWKEFSSGNNEDDRLSQFMGLIVPDIKAAITRIFDEIASDDTDKFKFLKMISSGQI
jgi:hypothetical protein